MAFVAHIAEHDDGLQWSVSETTCGHLGRSVEARSCNRRTNILTGEVAAFSSKRSFTTCPLWREKPIAQ
jgi:hypothetical protein